MPVSYLVQEVHMQALSAGVVFLLTCGSQQQAFRSILPLPMEEFQWETYAYGAYSFCWETLNFGLIVSKVLNCHSIWHVDALFLIPGILNRIVFIWAIFLVDLLLLKYVEPLLSNNSRVILTISIECSVSRKLR